MIMLLSLVMGDDDDGTIMEMKSDGGQNLERVKAKTVRRLKLVFLIVVHLCAFIRLFLLLNVNSNALCSYECVLTNDDGNYNDDDNDDGSDGYGDDDDNDNDNDNDNDDVNEISHDA
uniref:Uncharacterized protein n=1 Tax=Glossina pallidipes TaxID=7398 RepID=A0A1A9Z4A8_GLOPL